MKKLMIIAVVLIAGIYMAGCSGTGDDSINTQDINPKAEAAGKDTQDVTLYYSYRGEYMLAGETRTIDVPVNETLEMAVVRALIDGPSADRDEMAGLFWDDVALVRTETNADILLVTLSESFATASRPDDDIMLEESDAAHQKKLAITSIVNTIVEMGTYSRVQILVDRESGIGQRITKSEAGWADGDGDYLEPLGYDRTLVLTPENTLAEALGSYGQKDWTQLYNFTAYVSPDGTQKPDETAFKEALDAGNVLQGFSMQGYNVAYDGQTAVVMLDYTIKTREGETISRTNIPIRLIREKDIWKLSYHSLMNMLINV
jgi:hypothetical protein